MNKLENLDIRKLVLSMSLPIMVSMLVQALYNIVDSVFVAWYSQEALFAISLCYPVQTIMIAVACGIGVGFNTVLARFLGEKNQERANQTVVHGIGIALINWALFAIIGYFFSELFLSGFTSEETVILQGSQYLRICTMASFGVFVQITYERILQATGNSFYNMILQTAGALTNIVLDPIFIFGYFGIPKMGVAGAAWATVIGQVLAMFLGIWIVKRKIHEIHINRKAMHFSKSILVSILKIGIPATLTQAIMSFMTTFMNVIFADLSQMAVSVFNVYFKLQQFVFMAISGLTNALIPIISYSYGAKRVDRALGAVRFSLGLTIGIMVVGTLIFQIFPSQLLAMYSATQSMYDLGIPALRIVSLSFVFAGISMVLCSVFQASNSILDSLLITLLRQLVLLVPLTYFLVHRFGIDIGWSAFVITEGVCCTLSVIRWKKLKTTLV